MATGGGGGDPSVLDANYPPTNCWPEAPWGGGGGAAWEGGFKEGRLGGGSRRGFGGGGSGGFVGGAQAPLTSPCPPSNHTITINLTLTFAAS